MSRGEEAGNDQMCLETETSAISGGSRGSPAAKQKDMLVIESQCSLKDEGRSLLQLP